jgi:uncharacterized protein YjbI with pentapeptide repeats
MLSHLFEVFIPTLPDRRGLLDLPFTTVKEAVRDRGLDWRTPPGPPAYVRRFRSASVYRIPTDTELSTAFADQASWVSSGGATGSTLVLRFVYLSGERLKRLGLHPSAIDLERANFYGSCFDGVDLREAEMNDVTFGGAVFWKTDLTKAKLPNADLSDAYLEDADLSGANLFNANLTRTRLHRATLTDANLDDATVDQTVFTRADLSRATLKDATVTGADFSDATLKGVVASGVDTTIMNSILLHADLNQADFTQATLSIVDFRKALLEEADFQKADMIGTPFRGATLWKTDFKGAKMELVDFSEVDLRESELADADLYQANFQRAMLERQDLQNAKALRVRDFAKSNVARAELPEDVKSFHGLTVVNTATEKAQKLFIALGIACLYAVLAIVAECAGDNCVAASAESASGTSTATVMDGAGRSDGVGEGGGSIERNPETVSQEAGTTTDGDTTDRPNNDDDQAQNRLSLPFVEVEVSLFSFLIAVPILLTLAFGYFHLQLQRLWEGIARLPAVFPDGSTVDRRIQPWLVTGIVYAYFPFVRTPLYGGTVPPAYFAIHKWAIIALTWGLVPATQWVFLYHAYYLYRGNQGLTLAILIGSILTLVGAAHGFSQARETLGGSTVESAEGEAGPR